MNLIEANKDSLNKLCDSHKVKELYLFGSILTEKFNDSSDIDMLILFSQVDLLENQSIRNPIFRRIIDREKQLVYERKDS